MGAARNVALGFGAGLLVAVSVMLAFRASSECADPDSVHMGTTVRIEQPAPVAGAVEPALAVASADVTDASRAGSGGSGAGPSGDTPDASTANDSGSEASSGKGGVGTGANAGSAADSGSSARQQTAALADCTAGKIGLAMLEVAEEAEKHWNKHKGNNDEWWAFQVDPKKCGGVVLVPQLSVNQWRAMAEYAMNATTYLEWGSGGSTEYIAPLAKRAYTIEHYEPWCQCLMQRPVGRCMRKAGRMHFNCVNTGLKLCKWGAPCDRHESDAKRAGWKKYVDAIDTLPEKTYDVVLSDGRGRVGAAVKALNYVHENSIVMIHDWNREQYKEVLEFYHLVKVVEGRLRSIKKLQLGVLRPKKQYIGDTTSYLKFINEWQ